MGTGAIPLKVATTVATLAFALAMTTSTMEDTKHCNMYEPSSYNIEHNEGQWLKS